MALSTQQIAGLNALNQKIATGYKPTATDTANLDYATKQGYTYNPIPQGATKITDPNYLKTAGLNESQIYRSGQDIYKLPQLSSVETTVDPSVKTPIIPEPDNVDVIPSLMAGLQPGNKGTEARLKSIGQELASQPKANALQTRLEEAMGEQKTAQRDLQVKTQDQFKLQENFDKVSALMPQIARLEADYNRLAEENLNRPISSRIIGGTADKIQRQKAIELAGLSAVAQAYQGNVDLARQIAQDAVNAQYQDITNYNNNLKTQLDAVYDDLSREERVKADQLQTIIDERNRMVEEEKVRTNQINEIMLSAAQSGADPATIKAIQSSKTVGDAIKNSGNYLMADKNIQVIGQDDEGKNIYGYYDKGTNSFVSINGQGISNPTASSMVAAETSDLPSDVVSGTPTWARVLIASTAEETGVPASLISAVIKQESGFNPNASNVNAKETSYGLGQINLKAHPEITKEQATDPGFAIKFVANRLKEMIDRYGLYDGVQAYNTPGAIGSEQLKKYADNILSMAGVKTQQEQPTISSRAELVLSNPAILSNYTNTEKGKIIDELARAGVDTTPLEITALGNTAIKDISQSKDALDGLLDLSSKISNNIKYIGPIKGLQAINPWSKARKVQSDIDRIRQTVGKALEGGVLRKEDEEKYKKILATITDTPETAQYKISQLISDIQSNIVNYGKGLGLSEEYIKSKLINSSLYEQQLLQSNNITNTSGTTSSGISYTVE